MNIIYKDISSTFTNTISSVNYLLRASNFSKDYVFRNNKSELEIIKKNNSISNNKLLIALDFGEYNYDHGFSIQLEKKIGCFFKDNKIIVECIIVKNDFILHDPFILDKDKIIKNIAYSFSFDNISNILIFPQVKLNTKEKYFCFIRLHFDVEENKKTRWNNGFIIRNPKKHKLKNRSLFDFCNDGYDDICFPEVRYIKEKTSNNVLLSFAPLNTPKYRYNTSDFFKYSGYNRLIINDSTNQWYLRGFKELGNSPKQTCLKIKEFIQEKNYNLFTFGVSMGGYASFVYGNLIGASRIIAINAERKLMDKHTRSSYYIKKENVFLDDFIDFMDFYSNKPKTLMLFSGKSTADYNSYKSITEENIHKILIDIEHNFGDYLELPSMWIANFYNFGEVTI